MAFLKRVFSPAYRRALTAEAAGEYREAARAYALAGERPKVAEMHLLLAERAPGREARIAELRAAALWTVAGAEATAGGGGALGGAGEPQARIVRRIARALLETAKAGGVLSDKDKGVLREAASLFSRAGDGVGAGEALELCGDEQGAADAYQSAGDVERLERVLDRDEERRRVERQLRAASEEYELHLRRGERTRAIERLRECVALSPSGPSRQQLEALEARRLASGVVILRARPGDPPVVHAGPGAFPVGIGREPGCGILLRDVRVSRRHCEIVEMPGRPGRLAVRDCGSRNGTTLGGVAIAGEIPLQGEGQIGLGDAALLAFRADGPALRLEVLRGPDRGLTAIVSSQPVQVAGGALSLRFEGGVPLVEPAARPLSSVRLNGAAPGPAIELLRGDHLEIVEGGSVVASLRVE